MRIRTSTLAVLAAAVLLTTACGGGGGGGDSDGPASTVSPVSGAWQGTTASGSTLSALVLDDGTLWVKGSGPGAQQSLLRATLQADSGQLNASNVLYFLQQSPTTAIADRGSLQGSYQAASSMTATLTTQSLGVGGPYTLTPMPASTYDYARAASLGDIAGNWLMDAGLSVTVSASGNLTGHDSVSGCGISGNAAPHPSGKNVFNLSITFGAACSIPNTTLTGVALTTGSGASARLLTMGLHDAGTVVYALIVTGTRP